MGTKHLNRHFTKEDMQTLREDMPTGRVTHQGNTSSELILLKKYVSLVFKQII